MKPRNWRQAGIAGCAALGLLTAATAAQGSSHMDAPLITLDDAANTTDVYAFRSQSEDGATQYLTTALAVYPFQEPGIGPNNYRFDDRVRYEIHVALDGDVPEGRRTLTYRFEFETKFDDEDTILQSYLGEVAPLDGAGSRKKPRFSANQNLRQSYKVTKIDHRRSRKTRLGKGAVPPNNQGLVTRFYNQNDDGEMPAKEGVAFEDALDPYTRAAIVELRRGYRSFAGQRDDGFYADIQSIFDLDFSFGTAEGLSGAGKPFDSQGGFNVHTIVLNIPLAELDGAEIAGVYATTSRDFSRPGDFEDDDDDDRFGSRLGSRSRGFDDDDDFVQVGRQGNPLFAEALIAIRDKDLYNRSEPTDDGQFAIYAQDPVGDSGIEISRLLNVTPPIPGLVEGIFIPDLIKVDLTTGPARLAGQEGFHRLGFFGGDMLQSEVQDPFGNGGLIPGGWPNGRRFGDDVDDIAFIAVGIPAPEPVDPVLGPNYDGVTENDITFNDVFPYAATPQNGRVHGHHGEAAEGF